MLGAACGRMARVFAIMHLCFCLFLFFSPLFNLVLIEWLTIPAYPSLMCSFFIFFNKGYIEVINSLKNCLMFVKCIYA